MIQTNPFSTSFGKIPQQFLSRTEEENTIIEMFNDPNPSQQVFMITGIRGSGKTALLSKIKNYYEDTDRWIVVELNAESNMLENLVDKLCDIPFLRILFRDASINLSFFGVSLGLDSEPPIKSVSTALSKMLKAIKKADKRLLITVDEATNSKNMRIFISEFQILLRDNYPVFLIMTGLFKNLYDLQNEKTLTFLYRAPKIMLKPIDSLGVMQAYKSIFNIETEQAIQMAENVKGYAFAFQLYGSLCFESNGDFSSKKLIDNYTEQLGELVYEKLWMELSEKDRKIVSVLAKHGSKPVKIADLVNEYNNEYSEDTIPLNSKLMSVYRERLKKEGLITTETFGYIQLSLPRFSEFINEYGAILM